MIAVPAAQSLPHGFKTPGLRPPRHRSVAILTFFLFLGASSSLGQQYVLSTLAGGPPPTPSIARSASIYQPNGVAVDANGNVFFTSLECVFRVGRDGVLTRIAGTGRRGFSGDGGPAVNAQLGVGGLRAGAGSALTVDREGNVYVPEFENHRVRKIAPDGTITTIAGNGVSRPATDGTPATSASIGSPIGVAVGDEGALLIADQSFGSIWKVSRDGVISAVFRGDSPDRVSGDRFYAFARDAAGNLYLSDAGHHKVVKVAPDGAATTIAGTGVAGFSGDGGPASAAQIAAPHGIAADASGNVFFVDSNNRRVRKIGADGRITTVAGGGKVFPGDRVMATQAELFEPEALAIDGDGNLFVAAGWIQRISPDGTISIVAGNGTYSYGGDGGPAGRAQLWRPSDIALDALENLVIVDLGNAMIRRVAKDGIITTVAGNGVSAYSGDGGPATKASLSDPYSAAVDAAGNIFIADTNNHRIRMVAPEGTITTVAGNGTSGWSGDGGPAKLARLNAPLGIAVAADGSLFIADSGNSRVRKVSRAGVIETVAGTGAWGFSGDGGPATAARLSDPFALAFDTHGNLFIADRANYRIRMVSPAGTISTVAGDGSYEYKGDGLPAVNTGILPNSIALDAAGNLFFTDGYFIRKISKDGVIETIAGMGPWSVAGQDGPAKTSGLGVDVRGIKVDSSGRLYLADFANSIRILRPVNRSVLIGSVVDAASQRPAPLAPGKIVVIYGTGLGPVNLVVNKPAGGAYSTQLAGTSVLFNGAPGPLLYTSSTQVAAIAPYGLCCDTAEVVVTYQGNASESASVPIGATAPSLFSANGTGAGQAAATNGDGSLNDATHPVPVGGYVSLYATGEGRTTPAGQDGKIAGLALPLPEPRHEVSVTVDGEPARILYAGSAPGSVAGLMQIVIQIPAAVRPGGYVPVVLRVGTASTVAGALWIAVSR